jgi:hypothetical protein
MTGAAFDIKTRVSVSHLLSLCNHRFQSVPDLAEEVSFLESFAAYLQNSNQPYLDISFTDYQKIRETYQCVFHLVITS